MTILLRSLRLICLSIWVGALVFFGFVAQVAFQNLPNAFQAGLVVRGSLLQLHRLGEAAGILYFVFTVVLIASQRDTHPVRAAELAFVIAMLCLTAYSQLSVMPSMERDRASLAEQFHTEVDKSPADAPAHQHFDRLHNLSVKLEGAVLIEGLLLLALSTIHGRDDFDRFA
jgi:hypothetical protein